VIQPDLRAATGSDSARVAIAGGGIDGMALALSLHAAGLTEVDVYELTELGLLDELDTMGIPTAELAYYSRRGRVTFDRLGVDAL
jgi:2-polyprenyl-6-methoxyphenol hydroxylase-like FAD-dependent oxidoreductase